MSIALGAIRAANARRPGLAALANTAVDVLVLASPGVRRHGIA